MIENQTETQQRLQLAQEAAEFLYAEADILDQWKYFDWLELLADDIRYWMPLARNYKFGEQEREYTRELQDLAWFDENKTTLELRVNQLMTGIHWAEEPLSRMSHLVTNVRIVEASPSIREAEQVTAKCRFLVYRNRLQDEADFMVGKREDTLRKVDGEWKLARRAIFLDQNVLLTKNLTFIL